MELWARESCQGKRSKKFNSITMALAISNPTGDMEGLVTRPKVLQLGARCSEPHVCLFVCARPKCTARPPNQQSAALLLILTYTSGSLAAESSAPVLPPGLLPCLQAEGVEAQPGTALDTSGLWNRRFDDAQLRPLAVAYPRSTEAVQAAVRCALEAGVKVAPK